MTITGSEKSRTRNFRNRLQIERDVLAVVNNVEKLPAMVGLTADSINAWSISASKSNSKSKIDEIKATILMISRSAGTITDDSRAIVSEVEAFDVRIDLLNELRKQVAEL